MDETRSESGGYETRVERDWKGTAPVERKKLLTAIKEHKKDFADAAEGRSIEDMAMSSWTELPHGLRGDIALASTGTDLSAQTYVHAAKVFASI